MWRVNWVSTTRPSQNLGYNRPSEGSKQSERASRAVVRWSRKRMREELEGENVETTEDQPMETENRRIKDVGTHMLSGDVFQSNCEHTKQVET